MKLSKSFWYKFLSIIFWYISKEAKFVEKDLPNSLCPLFWLTLVGLIILPIATIVKICFVILDFIFGNITQQLRPIFRRFTDTDTFRKVDETVKNRMFFIAMITGWVVFSAISVFVLKTSDFVEKLFPVIGQILIIINAILFLLTCIAAVGLGIVWVFIKFLGMLFRTKVGDKVATTVVNGIEDIFAVISNKYCPRIEWQQNGKTVVEEENEEIEKKETEEV